MREEIISGIDFTEEEYNEKIAGQEGMASFDEFIDNVVKITEENNGTVEDAVFIADDAFRKL